MVQEFDLCTKCVIEVHIQWLEIDHRFDTELPTSKSKNKNKNKKTSNYPVYGGHKFNPLLILKSLVINT